MAKINLKAIVPVILTSVGILGTIVTIKNCNSDTVKAMKKLEEDEVTFEKKSEELKYTWKCYIPTMVSGSVTVLSIAAAGYLNHKTEMALAAALAFNKENFKKFEHKAKEIIGEDKVREIKTEIAKDELKKVKPEDIPKTPIPDGMIRLYDPYTDQFILTTMEKISLTMLALNKDLTCREGASYNKFLRLLGGKESKNIDLLGWSLSNDIQDYNWSYQYDSRYWIEMYTNEEYIDNQMIQVVCFNVGPEIQGPEEGYIS